MPAITLQKTNVGRNLFRDGSKGTGDVKVRYIALGTGNSTPSAGNTRLDAEIFRKAITAYTDGATGEELITVYIAPNDVVGIDIAEVGIYAGSNATNQADTGVLIARGLYPHPDKSNTESIVLQFDLNVI